MSDRWNRDSILHKEPATVYETFDKTWAGHSHDRIHGDDLVPGVAATIAMNGDSDNVDFDITATQKMISAISGSLITSLLGKSYLLVCHNLNF
jgi:solute carrier family 25 protein 39/40